jgi:glycosyltransferase involved in cell wall biosynthesis
MFPRLTIAVANRNHKHLLPSILKSIQAQKFGPLEVIVVDDASDELCDDIIAEYRRVGMDIHLIRHNTRQYTKNVRLTAVRAARAKYISFADADDFFLENGALEKHLLRMEAQRADIVHAPVAELGKSGELSGEWAWSRPFAAKLEGREIFSIYARENARGHVLHGKIFSRKIWLDIFDVARASSIRHWREDLFLFSLFLFHAGKYVGSGEAAYAYARDQDKIDNETAETAEAMCLLLWEFIPHLRENNCCEEDIENISLYFLLRLYSALRKMTQDASPYSSEKYIEDIIKNNTINISIEMLVKSLLIGYHQALVVYDRKSKILLEERKQLVDMENRLYEYKRNCSSGDIEKLQEPRIVRYTKDKCPNGATGVEMLKDAHKGRRCFIIGNGPSLNKINFNLLKNEVTIGCNGIFYKTEETEFFPNFYTVEDNEFIAANRHAINEYARSIRVIPICYWQFITNKKNTYWFEINMEFYAQDSPYYCIPRFSRDFAYCAYAGQTITYINMQLAFWLGCSEVYLIGMDHHYIIPDDAVINGSCILSEKDDANHFHPNYFKGKIWHDPKLDRVETNFRLAREIFEAEGRVIRNATVGGRLEIFDRVSFDSLF